MFFRSLALCVVSVIVSTTNATGFDSEKSVPRWGTRPAGTKSTDELFTMVRDAHDFASNLEAAVAIARMLFSALTLGNIDALNVSEINAWESIAHDLAGRQSRSSSASEDLKLFVDRLLGWVDEEGPTVILAPEFDSEAFIRVLKTRLQNEEQAREIENAILNRLMNYMNAKLHKCRILARNLLASPRFLIASIAREVMGSTESAEVGLNRLIKELLTAKFLYSPPTDDLYALYADHPFARAILGTIEIEDFLQAFVPKKMMAELRSKLSAQIQQRPVDFRKYLRLPRDISNDDFSSVIHSVTGNLLSGLGQVRKFTVQASIDTSDDGKIRFIKLGSSEYDLISLYKILFQYLQDVANRWSSLFEFRELEADTETRFDAKPDELAASGGQFSFGREPFQSQKMKSAVTPVVSLVLGSPTVTSGNDAPRESDVNHDTQVNDPLHLDINGK